MGIGTYLGEYTIVRTIGQGAFSKVKLAYHRESGEKVAIKIIDKEMMRKMVEKQKEAAAQRRKKRPTTTGNSDSPANLADSPNQPSSFDSTVAQVTEKADKLHDSEGNGGSMKLVEGLQKEVQLMMRLHHPNILKIYQVIESENECYMVLEYAKGELSDLLAMQERLSEAQSRKFFRQLISAIDHCHSADVIHRDIKLENLLLSESGELLVSDFGLGRGYNHQSILSETFCGTPNYAAIELISGIPYYGAKSDIWSMGIILFVMASGKAPFEGNTISTLYKSIKSIDYTCPSYFSPGLSDLISKIFVKDPSKRIDMNGLRSHPWVNQSEPGPPPRIAPKFQRDVGDMGGLISSIYVDDQLKVYTFISLIGGVTAKGKEIRSRSLSLNASRKGSETSLRRKSIQVRPRAESSGASTASSPVHGSERSPRNRILPNDAKFMDSLTEDEMLEMQDGRDLTEIKSLPPTAKVKQSSFSQPSPKSPGKISNMERENSSDIVEESIRPYSKKNSLTVDKDSTPPGLSRSSSIRSRKPSIKDNKVVFCVGPESSITLKDINSTGIQRMSMVGPRKSIISSNEYDHNEEEPQMEFIEEWHLIHRPPKEIRSTTPSFKNKFTSNVLEPAVMFQDLHQCLINVNQIYDNRIVFKRHPDFYLFKVEYNDPEVETLSTCFEVEICKIYFFGGHTLRFKRISGNALVCADIQNVIVNELNWETLEE